MQDNEEMCPCGHSLDECICRQGQRGEPSGEVGENSDSEVWWEGAAPPADVQVSILALLYYSGKLEILPDGVRFLDA